MIDGRPVTAKAAWIRYSVTFGFALLMNVALVMARLDMPQGEFELHSWIEHQLVLSKYMPPWSTWIVILTNVWAWSEFVVMLTNKRRQSIHDFMAQTVVVKNKSS